MDKEPDTSEVLRLSIPGRDSAECIANRSMAAQISSHIPRLVRVHMICTARNAIDPAIDTLDELQGSIAGAGAR